MGICQFLHALRNCYKQISSLSLLRQHYWIPSCKGLIRKILHDYLRCKRDRVLPKPTFMGDLPKKRLSILVRPHSTIQESITLDYIMLKGQK